MLTMKDRNANRKIRHERLRKKLAGTPVRPRLAVYRSLKHIYAQLIDDENGVTLASISTKCKDLAKEIVGKNKVDQAKVVGKFVGEKAKGDGIASAVFDRGGYKFHGRVKALCEAAREAGLDI